MEPSENLLARLDRIVDLDRRGAAPVELIGELRELISEAESGGRDRGAEERGATKGTDDDTGRWSGAHARRLHGT